MDVRIEPASDSCRCLSDRLGPHGTVGHRVCVRKHWRGPRFRVLKFQWPPRVCDQMSTARALAHKDAVQRRAGSPGGFDGDGADLSAESRGQALVGATGK